MPTVSVAVPNATAEEIDCAKRTTFLGLPGSDGVRSITFAVSYSKRMAPQLDRDVRADLPVGSRNYGVLFPDILAVSFPGSLVLSRWR